MALNLPYGIKPVNAMADVDERYGPYTSKSEALIATAGTRKEGLTVGIFENGEVVEYWFKTGVTDSDLISKVPVTEVIDTSTAEVWDEETPYISGNVFVSYINLDSLDVFFHSAGLYRCRVSTIAGLSPEDSLYDAILNPTGSWEYQGTKVTISTSSTATTVVQTLDELKAISGYKTGHTVSVISTNLTYRFDVLDETGIKPNDNGAGTWVNHSIFHAGHIVQDKDTTYDDRLKLKFIGNVSVSNLSDTTLITLGWNNVNIDSAITTSFNATDNNIYVVDGTTAPVTAILPNSTVGDFGMYRFVLKSDPHKLTITTSGGVQLIGNSPSISIPTVNGSVLLESTGTGYSIVTDTRQLVNLVEITENRDFTTDGFENNVIYYTKPNGGEITLTLPEAFDLPGSPIIKSRFEQYGSGRTVIQTVSGLIGNSQTQIITDSQQGFDIIWKSTEYLIQNDTRPKILTTSYTTYPVVENSTITDSITGTFFKQRVSTIQDSRFDRNVESELSAIITANPSDSYQVITSSITDIGILNGLIPEGALNIYWNLRVSSSTAVNAFVRYYKRTSLGVETLIATSSTAIVSSATMTQFVLSTTHDEFSMTSDDRLIIRGYARKNTTGANPTLYFGSEGNNPTRSVLEVSAGTISHNQIPGRDLEDAHPASAIQLTSGESVETRLATLYTESSVSPIAPKSGDRWLDTTSSIEYTWFQDTDGQGAWVSWFRL